MLRELRPVFAAAVERMRDDRLVLEPQRRLEIALPMPERFIRLQWQRRQADLPPVLLERGRNVLARRCLAQASALQGDPQQHNQPASGLQGVDDSWQGPL